MSDRSKYRMIADTLRFQIQNGDLPAGARFFTRADLCSRYHISLMTAFRVQKDLQESAMISNRPGVGFFVNSPEVYLAARYFAPLRQVRMIGSPQAIGPGTKCGDPIMRGIRQVCQSHGLTLNVELVQVLDNPFHLINTTRKLQPDEGLLVFLHDELLPEIVNLLLNPHVRAVVIGQNFPNRTSVLADVRHGISEILSHYHRHHVRRIVYAGQFSSWLRQQLESEIYADFCQLSGGFETHADFSGHFSHLCDAVQEHQADAVFFTEDTAAGRFLRLWRERKCGRSLMVTGFGDNSPASVYSELVTTYHFDMEAMGRRAAELLLAHDEVAKLPLSEWIAGHLMVP